MSSKSKAPARILAVVALVAAVVALMMIVGSASEVDSNRQRAGERTEQAQEERRNRPRRAVYVIRDGDTLLGIAGKTGVDVDRLQELNPAIDPQVLIAGQRIRLR